MMAAHLQLTTASGAAVSQLAVGGGDGQHQREPELLTGAQRASARPPPTQLFVDAAGPRARGRVHPRETNRSLAMAHARDQCKL